VDGFCTDYESMMPQRTTFVRALSQIKDANDFQDACFAQLAEQPTLNIWFDPIDPLSSIT